MTEKKEAFLKILHLELEDLQHDLDDMIGVCNARYQRGEISNYVHVENLGVLENERNGIHSFSAEVSRMDFSGCIDPSGCRAVVESHLDSWTHDMGVIPAAKIFIRRKLDKVEKYVTHHPL